ncbi:MAG: hypothetical protein CVU00_14420, partial [Bacteroidetes bacterium HGW-Bacteroidetes-17]
MKNLNRLSTAVIICVAIGMLLSCKKDDPKTDPQIIGIPDTPVTDYDGNTYQTVKMGNQIWMAENLKATSTSNETSVAGVYIYNNSESNLAEYGRLYTWEAAKKPFITGWHLPSEAEWGILARTLGSDVAVKLKVGGSSGFEGKFGGYRTYTGEYVEMGSWGVFWTSTVYYTSDHAFARYLFSFN